MDSLALARAAELLAAIGFLVTGISHIVQPRAWVEFFISLRNKGRVGIFVNAFIHFNFGALLVAFHNVWSWPRIGLTLIGWAFVVKGTLSFIAPHIAMLSLNRVRPERAWEFQVAGAFSVLLAAGCFYLWAL
ncbi:MAG: hypothetical protein ACT4OG_08300 [Alphaproteobacteria bacterium]